MNRARIARIARLVALRQQQRRLRETQHAQAQRTLYLASDQRERCVADCEALDEEHDRTLGSLIDPLDLELLGLVRLAARGQLREADQEVEHASAEAEERRAELLGAHQAHRSLELYHERVLTTYRRELIRTEQRDLDELSQRATGTRRPW